jgi:nucleoside-diphosphate-sugar epimerase
METVVLRPAAVYGPRDTDLLPLFKMAQSGWLIVPADSGLLQPVYVTEVALAVLAAASRPAGFGPFPVAESARYSWREVTVCLEDALGCAIHTVRLPATAFELAGRAAEWAVKSLGSAPIFDKRRAQDLAVYSWTCDPSGTEDALGWRAAVPLSEGLGRTAKWYREAGWL